MWFKHRAWIPIGWLLSVANVVSVWFAARPGEPTHATVHALLAVLFGVGAHYLTVRKGTASHPDVMARLGELEARLADVDAAPDVDSRLPELEERLDFIERAMVDVRNRAQLPRTD